MRALIVATLLLTFSRSAILASAETPPATSPPRERSSERDVSAWDAATSSGQPAEPVFSGPQVGEKLPPLPLRGVFDEDAGKNLDFVTAAAGKPIVLVFVHEINRPTIGMARALTSYTLQRAGDGLTTGLVWLDDDATAAENTLKRIRHALPRDVPVGISMDGKEGPGSYGLNRNVALTILVGNEGRVTANFALVQPSIQVDLPKVFAEIVRVVGGEVPSVADFAGPREAMRGPRQAEPDPQLRRLIRRVIQLDATEATVDKAAQALESYLEKHQSAQREVGRISKTIISSGKLPNYGTPRAQEYLRKWAERYGGPAQGEDRRTNDGESSQKPPEATSR
jgi:hypothetical protein